MQGADLHYTNQGSSGKRETPEETIAPWRFMIDIVGYVYQCAEGAADGKCLNWPISRFREAFAERLSLVPWTRVTSTFVMRGTSNHAASGRRLDLLPV
jgi:hypothetical protein